MNPVDVTLTPSLFEVRADGHSRDASASPEDESHAPVQISLRVEPERVSVPGRARVLVRVLRQGRPLDGFRLSISSSRGRLSLQGGTTRAGVLSAELQGQPDDVGVALVRVHSDVWEAQAVLSTGLEFVREGAA
jgi:hypothetical protein